MYNEGDLCHFCVICSTSPPSPTPSISASPAASAYVVLSTPRVVAFLSVAPLSRGHVLLMPREHHEKLDKVPSELSAVLGFWLPVVGRGVMAGLFGRDWQSKDESWNVVQANGRQAGQDMKHLDFHIVPRPRPESSPVYGVTQDPSMLLDFEKRRQAVAAGLLTKLPDEEGVEMCQMIKGALRREILKMKREGKIIEEEQWELWAVIDGSKGLKL